MGTSKIDINSSNTDNNKPFVLLTGSKNNAGDYLIKHRAKLLLSKYFPNTPIIDYNGWESLTDDKIQVINKSRALLLTGGPALQLNTIPNVYNLTRTNLDQIQTPILMFGVGWYSKKGKWEDTYSYPLSEDTLNLLRKIESSGHLSSLRDFHTLNVLQQYGFKNFIMTGCPATYVHPKPELSSHKIDKISFSTGVSFLNSPTMYQQTLNILKLLIKKYGSEKIKVVFHHSIDKNKYLGVYKTDQKNFETYDRFIQWLKSSKLDYIDISGSHEHLIEHYNSTDFHIGFRVHAHIFMSSITKPSILLSEDGRGIALKQVLGGGILNAVNSYKDKFSLLERVINKISPLDIYTPNDHLIEEIDRTLDYELVSKQQLQNQVQKNIENNLIQMEHFLTQLPK